MSLRNKKRMIEALAQEAAEVRGELTAAIEKLSAVEELEAVKRELIDTRLQIDEINEEHARKEREVEHKLGLHRIQVEQERAAAVTEAKLAVREEALAAAQENHKEQISFIRERMENEMEAHRAILNEVLTRLPNFQHTRVEHVGVDPNPPQRLEIENK